MTKSSPKSASSRLVSQLPGKSKRIVMGPADIVRAATTIEALDLAARRPDVIDASDIPESVPGENGVRDKYADRFQIFCSSKSLPIFAIYFRTGEEVNEALRVLLRFAGESAKYASALRDHDVGAAK